MKHNDFIIHDTESHTLIYSQSLCPSPDVGEPVKMTAPHTSMRFARMFAHSLSTWCIDRPLPSMKDSSCEFSSCAHKPLKQFSWSCCVILCWDRVGCVLTWACCLLHSSWELMSWPQRAWRAFWESWAGGSQHWHILGSTQSSKCFDLFFSNLFRSFSLR